MPWDARHRSNKPLHIIDAHARQHSHRSGAVLVLSHRWFMQKQISRDEYAEAVSGDLSEVCELHARGSLIEVIAVNVALDSGDFEGFAVAVGKIDGKDYSHDGLHNVTCIGDNFTYHDDARYYLIDDHKEAMRFAVDELMKLDLVDCV